MSLATRLLTACPRAPWRTKPTVAPTNRDPLTGILWRATVEGWRPDLEDAATIGVLLATARTVHNAPRLSVHWYEGDDSAFTEPGWIVDLGDGENVICGATDYAEALVIAIEEGVKP